MRKGFYGVGVYHPKRSVNIGSLWRSAHLMGASFIFTIGRRYKVQASDTTKASKTVPLWEFDNLASFFHHMPREALLVGVEQGGSRSLERVYRHPERAIYLLGAEDHGLPTQVREMCHAIYTIPSQLEISYNLAVAGSIVMYDRMVKNGNLESEADATAGRDNEISGVNGRMAGRKVD